MEKIIKTFKSEFDCISDKFEIIEEQVKGLLDSKKEFVDHPGVYVFFNDKDIIKVGRSLTNSRKRAYEHVTDNTNNKFIEMKDLSDNPTAKVLLFNVINAEDTHWVAAVEIFLETQLQPLIKSGRLG